MNSLIISHTASARIYNLLDLKETLSVIAVEEENRIDCCSWSNDGRLLAITGGSGNIYIYLTRLNMLASVWQPLGTVAVLTSLKEVGFIISLLLGFFCESHCSTPLLSGDHI